LRIKIVPPATIGLSFALLTWTKLRFLKLTNMSFENLEDGVHLASSLSSSTHPLLRVIHIGQTVFMSPLAAVLITQRLPSLEKLLLVDVYSASIWGKRLRMGDIEKCMLKLVDIQKSRSILDEALAINENENWESSKERIEVRVETERIIGGDRGQH
jgi:hypothetical protein